MISFEKDELDQPIAAGINLEKAKDFILKLYPGLTVSVYCFNHDEYGYDYNLSIDGECCILKIEVEPFSHGYTGFSLICSKITKRISDKESAFEYKDSRFADGYSTACNRSYYEFQQEQEDVEFHTDHVANLEKWLVENIKFVAADSELFRRVDVVVYDGVEKGSRKARNGTLSEDHFLVSDHRFYAGTKIDHSAERELQE